MMRRAFRRAALAFAAVSIFALPNLGCASAQRAGCAAVMTVDAPSQRPILRAFASIVRAVCRVIEGRATPRGTSSATSPAEKSPPAPDGPDQRAPVTPAP